MYLDRYFVYFLISQQSEAVHKNQASTPNPHVRTQELSELSKQQQNSRAAAAAPVCSNDTSTHTYIYLLQTPNTVQQPELGVCGTGNKHMGLKQSQSENYVCNVLTSLAVLFFNYISSTYVIQDEISNKNLQMSLARTLEHQTIVWILAFFLH